MCRTILTVIFTINKRKTIDTSLPYIIIIIVFLSISGCGRTVGGVGHGIETQVVLSQANYKVTGSAQGEASAGYILGFIGPSNDNLHKMARSNLVRKAKLSDGNKSKAIINVTTDKSYKYYGIIYLPLYTKKTVYISADIIEFFK